MENYYNDNDSMFQSAKSIISREEFKTPTWFKDGIANAKAQINTTFSGQDLINISSYIDKWSNDFLKFSAKIGADEANISKRIQNFFKEAFSEAKAPVSSGQQSNIQRNMNVETATGVKALQILQKALTDAQVAAIKGGGSNLKLSDVKEVAGKTGVSKTEEKKPSIGIPIWGYAAGGVVAVGLVYWFFIRKKA